MLNQNNGERKDFEMTWDINLLALRTKYMESKYENRASVKPKLADNSMVATLFVDTGSIMMGIYMLTYKIRMVYVAVKEEDWNRLASIDGE